MAELPGVACKLHWFTSPQCASVQERATLRLVGGVVIGALPRDWSGNDMKALIEPQYGWSEDELRKRALAALRSKPLADAGGEGPGA